MKKLLLLPFLLFALLGCDSDDEAEFSIDGKVFRLTNLLMESSVDFNNDGIYSFDLLNESDCFGMNGSGTALFFNEQNVGDPLSRAFFRLKVEYDDEGIAYQDVFCGHADALPKSYFQNGSLVEIGNSSAIWYNGTLSQNNSILTLTTAIDYPIVFEGQEILREDGTVEEYTGIITLIYELVE